MKIIYQNLKGYFSGEGFQKKNGRRLIQGDESFVKGPLSICVDSDSRKILEIAPTLEVTKNDTVIDATGFVATAAFLDSHTHSLFGGSRWNEFFDRWAGKSYVEINAAGGGIKSTFASTESQSDDELMATLQERLNSFYKEGAEAVEIKTGYGKTAEEELRLLRILKKFENKSSVKIYKTFLGLHAIPEGKSESEWTSEMIALLDVVAKEKLADFVDSFPEKGFFSLEESLRFMKAAQSKGLGVRIHADEITDMNAAVAGIELGALSVDHLQKISAKALSLLEKSPTVATLLPATSFYLGLEYAPARKILQTGARVALATDFNPGTAPSTSLKFTAKLAASQMKMNPAEILCGLTYNAAAALGCDKSSGLIQKNYHSQILLWKCESKNYLEEILLSDILPQR